MDGPREYYAKWNLSEEDKYYIISLICGIYKPGQMNKHNRVIDTENRQVVARGEGGANGWFKYTKIKLKWKYNS